MGHDVLVDPLEHLLRVPLDPVLVDAARLRIMAAVIGLPAEGRLSFTALRRLLVMTDGNLGMHLRVLSELGYIEAARQTRGRRRQSLYASTPMGRAAFSAHVDALQTIIAAAKGESEI